MNPTEAAATAEQAARVLLAGDAEAAATLYRSLAEAGHASVDHWLNLALVLRQTGDREAELTALEEALALEPRLLAALLMKGANLEDRGETTAAAGAFGAALAAAPPYERLPMDLRAAVRHAQAAVGKFQAARAAALREGLAGAYRSLAGAKLDRFIESVDVHLGQKAIYRQNPHNFYFPGLPETQFYDRAQFSWLETLEHNTDVIRAEFEAVWKEDHGFAPYVEYPRGVPLDQWSELNHSLRWSVFHLLKGGRAVAENAARCPKTLELLRNAPGPELPNRSPNAMFSLLNPRTRIPPHTGDTNVRLVVHLPLIIPDQTGFRVGNDIRPWRVGEAFVFNDTIEHEAWNDSDQLRVVLIFDIWHPDISTAEKILVGRLMEASDEFMGVQPSGL